MKSGSIVDLRNQGTSHRDLRLGRIHIDFDLVAEFRHTALGANESAVVIITCGHNTDNDQWIICCEHSSVIGVLLHEDHGILSNNSPMETVLPSSGTLRL